MFKKVGHKQPDPSEPVRSEKGMAPLKESSAVAKGLGASVNPQLSLSDVQAKRIDSPASSERSATPAGMTEEEKLGRATPFEQGLAEAINHVGSNFDNWSSDVTYLNEGNQCLFSFEPQNSCAQELVLEEVQKLLAEPQRERESCQQDLAQINDQVGSWEEKLKEIERQIATLTSSLKEGQAQEKKQEASTEQERWTLLAQRDSVWTEVQRMQKEIDEEVNRLQAVIVDPRTPASAKDSYRKICKEAEVKLEPFMATLRDIDQGLKKLKETSGIKETQETNKHLIRKIEEMKSVKDTLQRKLDRVLQEGLVMQEVSRLANNEVRTHEAALKAASSSVSSFIKKQVQDQVQKELGKIPAEVNITQERIEIHRDGQNLHVLIGMDWQAKKENQSLGKGSSTCSFVLNPCQDPYEIKNVQLEIG